MGRIRTVKPELALHEGLFDLEQETGLPIRYAWAMLPTQCDREGRFEWRPRRLKAALCPYDEFDFSRVLDAWTTRGFVEKYAVNGAVFGRIPTWHKHQVVNNRERPSDIPEPQETQQECGVDACGTRGQRVDDACSTESHCDLQEGKGREGNKKEQQQQGDEPISGDTDQPDWTPDEKTITRLAVAAIDREFITDPGRMATFLAHMEADENDRSIYPREFNKWVRRDWAYTNRGKSEGGHHQPAHDARSEKAAAARALGDIHDTSWWQGHQ